jgi:phosphatidylinositol alpha 1,6-mannosyltransferase
VLLEAGASGLPVIAAAAGGAPELVDHGASGLLVQPDDPDAFAAAIRRLGSSRPLRLSLGSCARSLAKGRSWSRSLDQLAAAYAAAVPGAAVAPAEALHV